MVKTKTKTFSLTPIGKADSFYTHILNNYNISILTQTDIFFNIIPQTLEYSKKPSLKLNPPSTKPVFVKHLNSSMRLLKKPIHMATLVKNSLSRLLINSTTFLIYPYGFLFLFMIALNVKRINTFLLNPLISPPLMKMLLFLIIESQWKELSLLLHKITPIFL